DLYPFLVLQSQAFKRIIEGLDLQANMLSKDYLKEILLNAEDNILRKIWEYVLDDNMEILIEDEKQITILEARIEYKELGSYELDNESDTESLQDPTVSGDENSDEDIFSTAVMHFQEHLSQQDN
ncbi:8234_t:CDS:2, partial [Racocetra fulgida]